MTKLIYSGKARDDLGEILDYIGSHAPGTAVAFVEGLIATCGLLSTHPLIGAVVGGVTPETRQLTHKRYVIYYRYNESEKSVRIVRVLHDARDRPEQELG